MAINPSKGSGKPARKVAAKKAAPSKKAPARKVAAKTAPETNPRKKTGPPPVKREGLDAHEAEIIEAIRGDQGYRAIATKYSVSKGTLIAWIQANPDRSHACARARAEAASESDERAETEILSAKDPFELARARELAVHLRWRAKVRDPAIYGDKVQVDGKIDASTISDDALLKQLAALGIAAKIGPAVEPEPEAPGA